MKPNIQTIAKARLCLGLVGLVGILAAFPAQAQEQGNRPVVRIGFIADEPDARSDQLRPFIQQELLELAQNDFDLQFPDDYNIVGDGTAENIAETVSLLLSLCRNWLRISENAEKIADRLGAKGKTVRVKDKPEGTS